MAYHRITFSERLSIEAMLKAGMKMSEIANEIGVHRATIYREIERGTVDGQYKANYAQTLINTSSKDA